MRYAVISILSIVLMSCVTPLPGKPVSYEQWRSDRQKLPGKISGMLAAVRTVLTARPDAFEKCFADFRERKVSARGLLSFTIWPREGRLALDRFASPEPLEGLSHENFGHCVDMILSQMTFPGDLAFGERERYSDALFVIHPSWTKPAPTTLNPSGDTIPPDAVCWHGIKQAIKVPAGRWDMRELQGIYLSDNAKILPTTESVFICTGTDDISRKLRFDERELERMFPDDYPFVVDGFR